MQEDSRIKRETMVSQLAGTLNNYAKETLLREIYFREDYENKRASKSYSKIFERSKKCHGSCSTFK